jgi:hypothetical protein
MRQQWTVSQTHLQGVHSIRRGDGWGGVNNLHRRHSRPAAIAAYITQRPQDSQAHVAAPTAVRSCL